MPVQRARPVVCAEEAESQYSWVGKTRGEDNVMTRHNRVTSEGQIRQLIENWTAALRAKDTKGLMSHYAPDVVVYDLAPPLRLMGTAGYARGWEEWFGSFDGPVGYEVHHLSVTAGDDVAFSTSLNRLSGRRTNGGYSDVWVRATVGYRKHDGGWKIAHEHVSVPLYMDGSNKAALDLKP